MNKEGRKLIAEALAKIAEARGILEEICNDEQETLDEMSERAREGAKGEEIQATIDALTEAMDALDTIDSELGGL